MVTGQQVSPSLSFVWPITINRATSAQHHDNTQYSVSLYLQSSQPELAAIKGLRYIEMESFTTWWWAWVLRVSRSYIVRQQTAIKTLTRLLSFFSSSDFQQLRTVSQAAWAAAEVSVDVTAGCGLVTLDWSLAASASLAASPATEETLQCCSVRQVGAAQGPTWLDKTHIQHIEDLQMYRNNYNILYEEILQ